MNVPAQLENKLTNNLLSIRLDQGKTQVELANVIGRRRPYISRIENGVAWPTIEEAYLLANYLKVEITDIFGSIFESSHKTDVVTKSDVLRWIEKH